MHNQEVSIAPCSMSLSVCGSLFVLDRYEGKIYIVDEDMNASPWLEGSVPDVHAASSIAADGQNVYVVDRQPVGKGFEYYITGLSGDDGQVFWEQPVSADIRIASAGKGKLIALDPVTRKVSYFLTGGFWPGEEWELTLMGVSGTIFELDAPIDIATDFDNNIYILDANNSILVFASNGEFIETVNLPLEDESQVLNIAVESPEILYIGHEKDEIFVTGDSPKIELSVVQLERFSYPDNFLPA